MSLIAEEEYICSDGFRLGMERYSLGFHVYLSDPNTCTLVGFF